MDAIRVTRSGLHGTVRIPGSKSHTIRAVFMAALADGKSEIVAPLDSADTQGAVRACRALGARIEPFGDRWLVDGTGGIVRRPDHPIDVGNSGTSLRIAMGASALLRDGDVLLTGDEQVRARPAGPLIDSLNDLGAEVVSVEGTGRAPIRVRGRLSGGSTRISCPTSQFLTSLLIACPFADGASEITVTELNERPYVDMTMRWLDRLDVTYDHDGYDRFSIPGGQHYAGFTATIPADFSSATFFICAAAITESKLILDGLDMTDTQGDKAVIDMVETMGAKVERGDGFVSVEGQPLKSAEFDLNATPDALPAMAVAACRAAGTTRLVNVPQARLKETDRISVMREELSKMGAHIEEMSDGLIIEGGPLHGAHVDGHGDHRVVMALTCAGMAADGETTVAGAESVNITFPTFIAKMRQCGASISRVSI